tara:strand:+ start:3518 stop:4513 length:996 start_codon:yes stop_codon:yes gene_type:complete
VILIDAVGINRGGGKILLDYLIQEIDLNFNNILFLFDKRILNNHPKINNNKTIYIKNNFIDRLLFYLKNKNKFSKVLCLANYSPPVKLDSKVFTLFQNVAIFDKLIYSGPIPFAKRIIFNCHLKNTDNWIVQTPSVKNLLLSKFDIKNEIYIYPFFSFKNFSLTNRVLKKHNQILYVSDGDPHKNHIRLFNAFNKFSKINPNFQLIVTISNNYPGLLDLIEKYNSNGISIKNIGFVSQKKLAKYFKTSMFFVYPSLEESFGLGLIEAANYKLPVVASDLDYVYDVINPVQTFDPYSEEDILKALMNYKNYKLNKSKVIVEDNIKGLIQLLK